ncbi:MAG: hypothetical protein AB8B60_11525 [Sulfitobacter sp.]
MLQIRCCIRWCVASALFLLMLGCAPIRDGVTTSDLNVVDPRKVIALVPDARATSDMQAAAQAKGYETLDVTRLNGLALTMLTFTMPQGVTGAQAIETLETAVPGSTVGINHAYRLQQTARGADAFDYANKMMRWREGGCRAQVPVGVIDTGIDAGSPALSAARVVNRSFFAGQAVRATHGTDVASVLANPRRLNAVTINGANVFGQSDALGPKAGAEALVRGLIGWQKRTCGL